MKEFSYPPEETPNLFQPEDKVPLKNWKNQRPEHQLAKKWTGTSHTSLKFTGVKPWIYHTQVKRALPEEEEESSPTTCRL